MTEITLTPARPAERRTIVNTLAKACFVVSLLAAFTAPASAQKIIQVVPIKPDSSAPPSPSTSAPSAPLDRSYIDKLNAEAREKADRQSQETVAEADRMLKQAIAREAEDKKLCAAGVVESCPPPSMADCIRDQWPQIGTTLAQFGKSCWPRSVKSSGRNSITTAAGVVEWRGYLNMYGFYFTNGILTATQKY